MLYSTIPSLNITMSLRTNISRRNMHMWNWIHCYQLRYWMPSITTTSVIMPIISSVSIKWLMHLPIRTNYNHLWNRMSITSSNCYLPKRSNKPKRIMHMPIRLNSHLIRNRLPATTGSSMPIRTDQQRWSLRLPSRPNSRLLRNWLPSKCLPTEL